MNTGNGFKREVFSNTYLTIIGIIQAAVFTYLIQNTIIYTSAAFGGHAFPNFVIEVFSDIYMWRVFATLVTIVLITFEYSFFVLLFHRPIHVFDISILFLVGIAEFYIAAHVTGSNGWWWANFAFAVTGLVAFANTLTFNLREIFGDDQTRIKTANRHTAREVVLVVIAGIFAFYVATKLQSGHIGYALEFYFTAAWIAFGVLILINGTIYVNNMTRSR